MTRRLMLIACAAALVTGFAAAPTHALSDPWMTNEVTFSRAVALPGTVLAAGTYTFEVVDVGSGGPGLVLVRDAQRPRYLAFTISVERPAGMNPKTVMTFGEAAAGEPLPIAAWYPLGSHVGHQFIR
jgi:hypothetical protein